MQNKRKRWNYCRYFCYLFITITYRPKNEDIFLWCTKKLGGLIAFTLDEVDIIENVFRSEMVVFVNRGVGV
ncbi:hypothetical protein KIMH_06510 [Bombiscardovia apis]|uniref:Uncharacterized protein n=1 Tax=Bombiscardovia apis TaxID=2932182 RepID=A0ABM8BCA5_9BIFI|nr:hypothetical protein KIMH_06510 [Bombiscardovia apis]